MLQTTLLVSTMLVQLGVVYVVDKFDRFEMSNQIGEFSLRAHHNL